MSFRDLSFSVDLCDKYPSARQESRDELQICQKDLNLLYTQQKLSTGPFIKARIGVFCSSLINYNTPQVIVEHNFLTCLASSFLFCRYVYGQISLSAQLNLKFQLSLHFHDVSAFKIRKKNASGWSRTNPPKS